MAMINFMHYLPSYIATSCVYPKPEQTLSCESTFMTTCIAKCSCKLIVAIASWCVIIGIPITDNKLKEE